MAENNPNPAPAKEPTLAELKALILQQNETISALQQQFTESLGNPGDEPTLADLADMSDEQLIGAGFDPGKVDAAIQQAIQSGELVVEGDPGAGNANLNGGKGGPNGNGEARGYAAPGEGGNADAATAVAGTVGAELADLRRGLIHFQQKEKRDMLMAERQEQEALFSAVDAIEKKCVELAAENDALRVALESGAGRPVSASGEIQFDEATGKPKTFEALCNEEFRKLMRSGKKGMTELKAKSQAVSDSIRKFPGAYREFSSSGRRGKGPIEFSMPEDHVTV